MKESKDNRNKDNRKTDRLRLYAMVVIALAVLLSAVLWLLYAGVDAWSPLPVITFIIVALQICVLIWLVKSHTLRGMLDGRHPIAPSF